METRILYIFTRTPLHVGAGSSVGAIDQPIQRERHTGFPVIPASSLKGSFADHWNHCLEDGKNGKKQRGHSEAAWLFGSDSTDDSFAGSLIFTEARVLAFPIRSAKGSFAWITCPLMLQRAKRDGVLESVLSPLEPRDNEAILKPDGPLALGDKVVLEEYCFTRAGDYPQDLANELAALVADDKIFSSITDRLVILSNGQMSHFATTACEVAQHVKISDETGTAEGTGLFNQENVPSDTLFYSVLSGLKSRVTGGDLQKKTAAEALAAFKAKVDAEKVFQFGADSSTGLGFCSVTIKEIKGA